MDVEVAEALYRIGWLRPGQLQEVAFALLGANHHGPAIIELAQSPYSTWGDVGDLLDRAFAEAGSTVANAGWPTGLDREAGMRVARYVAGQIVSGAIGPIEGAGELSALSGLYAGGEELSRFTEYSDDYGYGYPEFSEKVRRNIIQAAWDLLRT